MKTHKIALILIFGLGISASANAHNTFGFSINLGAPPVYYATPHAYYDVPRVYAEPPRIIYYDQPLTRYHYEDSPIYCDYHQSDYHYKHHRWDPSRHYDDDDYD